MPPFAQTPTGKRARARWEGKILRAQVNGNSEISSSESETEPMSRKTTKINKKQRKKRYEEKAVKAKPKNTTSSVSDVKPDVVVTMDDLKLDSEDGMYSGDMDMSEYEGILERKVKNIYQDVTHAGLVDPSSESEETSSDDTMGNDVFDQGESTIFVKTHDELAFLEPDFDLSSFTVPRLRSILVSYNISYPSSAKKAKLIELVEENVRPQRKKLLAARARVKRTSMGITDMPSQEGTVPSDDEETHQMLPPSTKTPRRTSRRGTRGTTADTETSSTRKSRSRRSASKHARASDTENGADTAMRQPARRRTRLSEIEPVSPEPVLPGKQEAGNESVFSDDNPFQSGGSPVYGVSRGSLGGEHRRRSKGTTLNKTDRRKSSRPHHTRGESSTDDYIKQEDGVVVPTSSTFEVPIATVRKPKVEPVGQSLEPGEEFTPEEQVELDREEARTGQRSIVKQKKRRPKERSIATKSAPWALILSVLTAVGTWWRHEKIEVGYCGVGKSSWTVTNPQIPEWASIIQPECDPCPPHAYCFPNFETRCEPDFVLLQHPLSLGGIVPLPPTCEPDGEKARRVKAVADRAVEALRERRASWECGTLADKSGKPAPAVEIVEDDLKNEMSRKRRKGMTDDDFNELWKGAIGEIVAKDEVVTSSDGQGRQILSSTSLARIPVSCAIRRSIRLALARHRIELGGLTLLLLFIAYLRNLYKTRRNDNARVPTLVRTTLGRLMTQAALHVQGTTQEGWISVGQLRDDILRDEFSPRRREEMWKKVKAIVEMNTNVRANSREGKGGEWGRAWEWIGSTQEIEDSMVSSRREGGRPSMGPIMSRNNPITDESKMERLHWDEGRPIY
ncbi:MAG: inner nuclear membrane protein enriched at telomere/subtelomere region [Cirrosporium novae-zelandiae]|nr:MAG: inner nuclear membrane protein enriched at telomere/subtelomere region [Cirrosporium novae-zelandiae]